MVYAVSQAPAGGTKTGAYGAANTQQSSAANAFMADWESKNPTGYDSDRAFMDADSNGYYDYQNRRRQAYEEWNKTQPQQGGNMPIIQSAMQQPGYLPNGVPTLSPGGANAVSQAQTQGYGNPVPSGQAQTTQAAPGQAPSGQVAQPSQPRQGSATQTNIGDNVNSEGIINKVATYNAAQVGDPTKWNVDKSQTMQGQLQQITAQDSPLMAQAKARAIEQMNERGLANSSMALTAAESALYDAAMPIAQNDAQTFAKAAGYNADMSNKFTLQNTDWQNQALMFGAEQSNLASRQNAQNINTTLNSRERNETTKWAAQLDADTRTKLGVMDADVRRYVADQDVGVRRELGYLDATVKREGFSSQERMNANDNDTRRYGYDVNAAVQRENIAKDRELGYLDANTRTNIAQMDSNTKLAVTQMGKEYDLLLQSSINSQNLYSNMARTISEIDRSSLDPQSKAYAIDRQMMVTRDALNTDGAVSGIPNLGMWFQGGYVA